MQPENAAAATGEIFWRPGKDRDAKNRLSKNPAEDFWDRAAGNVCKGLRPLARSINTYF